MRPGFDYFALMSQDNRKDYELFLSDRAEWEREGREQREQVLAWSLEEFAEQWSAGKSPVDRWHFMGSSALCFIEQSRLAWRLATKAGPRTTSRSFGRPGL